MMHLVKYIGFPLILALMTGCAPNNISLIDKPRLLHFSTPETSGGWGHASASVSSAFLEPDYIFGTLSSSAFDPNNITINEESLSRDGGTLNLSLWLGVMDLLDIYVDSESIIGLKYQLIGSPRAASEEGLKLTLSGQLGRNSTGKSAGNSTLDEIFNSLFDTAPTVSHTEATTKLLDISSNIGYRHNSKNITYLNTFISKTSFSGKLYSEDLGLSRSVTEDSKSFGFLAGYQYTTDANNYFTLEIGVTRTVWNTRGSANATPIGISYGGNW